MLKRILKLSPIAYVLVTSRAIPQDAADYSDVALIVNMNSPVSISIGNYFQSARHIPDENVVRVFAATNEEINASAFNSLRQQVEQYLAQRGLNNSINYLVTTKGLPLKVNREPNGGAPGSVASASASVESELALILGPYAGMIGLAGRTSSPYYNRKARFARADFGIFLVTRLDGYTLEDIISMIDRSGPGLLSDPGSGFVLDQDPNWNGELSTCLLNANMATASSALKAKGFVAELNTDSTYLTHRTGVAGYVSWGSNDHHAWLYTSHAVPHNAWAPGGIAETYVSTSARSFNAPPAYGQSLIADLLQEGASGAKGYVYEPYSTSMANPSLLFDRYTSGYNLAESFFAASPYLSWMGVVVGDPKTSFGSAYTALPVQMASFSASYSREDRTVTLNWSTLSEINNYGFYVQRRSPLSATFEEVCDAVIPGQGTSVAPKTYAWGETATAPGTYAYRLRQCDLDGEEHYSQVATVTVDLVSDVSPRTGTDRWGLAQNYPNPFNPTTTIRYTLAESGRVVLKVFNAAGALVATLVDRQESAGSHDAFFPPVAGANTLPTGMYFYRLETKQGSETRQMIYLK